MDRPGLHWIDKDAEEGPLFRIGDKDVYCRERSGSRIIRLKAILSPNEDYVAPAVEAFHTIAAHWNSPVIFVIDPDLKQPPAAQFLSKWCRTAHLNRSVDQCFMVMNHPLSQAMGQFMVRMFGRGGMPFEVVRGDAALNERLDQMNTQTGWDGFSVASSIQP